MAGILKFTPIALKNLFSKPATRAYPDAPARRVPGTRGSVQVDIDECIFCGMCNRNCPADAITVDRANKSWTVRRMNCVQCGYCVQSCPKKCITMDGAYSAPAPEKMSDLFRKGEPVVPAVYTLAPAPAGGKPIAPDRVLVLDMSSCVLCGLCVRRCPTGALQVDRKVGTWTVNRAECLQCGNCVNGCPKKSLALVPAQGQPEVETYTKSAVAKPVVSAPLATAQPAGVEGIAVDMSTCVLCGLCVRRCPTGAIEVDRAKGTWSINRQSCVVCGNCLDVCHKHSLLKTTENIQADGVQVYQKNAQPKVEAPKVEKPANDAPKSGATAGEGIDINMTTCVLCGICGKKCPTSAIAVDRAAKTWTIKRDECVLCGSCLDACPKKSLTRGENVDLTKETYNKPAPAPAPKIEIVEEPKAEPKAIKTEGIEVDMNACVLCGICGKKCPTLAIEVDRVNKKWTIRRDECVLCGNCITTCPKKCLTRSEAAASSGIQTYEKPIPAPAPKPEAATAVVEKGEGIAVNMDTCVLCGICAKKCPTSAIEVDRANKTWTIKRSDCTLCETCVEICPKDSLTHGESIDISKLTYAKPVPVPAPKVDAPKGDGIAVDMNTCVLCGICAKKCPTSAIVVDRPNKTWTIKRSDCTLCETCVAICPKHSLTHGETELAETYTK